MVGIQCGQLHPVMPDLVLRHSDRSATNSSQGCREVLAEMQPYMMFLFCLHEMIQAQDVFFALFTMLLGHLLLTSCRSRKGLSPSLCGTARATVMGICWECCGVFLQLTIHCFAIAQCVRTGGGAAIEWV